MSISSDNTQSGETTVSEKFPSQFICIVIYVFTFNLYTGCNNPPPLEHHRSSAISVSGSIDPTSSSEEGGIKSKEYVFAETNVSEMSLETVTGSKDEACLTKDFMAVREGLPQGPLECGEDGLVYQVRITNCSTDKLTLTALNFLFEIPKISNGEDAEHRLFDGEEKRTHRLHDIRVCDNDNPEWCRDAVVERISEKSAKISVSLNDEEVVELESEKDWVFDVKTTRNCSRTTTSLLRLDIQLKEVEGSSNMVGKDENIFGVILNPRQKIVISGWAPRVYQP